MLGFAVLMTGMQMMSGAVSPLRENQMFINMLACWYPGRYFIYRSAAECFCDRWCTAGVVRDRNPDFCKHVPDRTWYRCRCGLSGSDLCNRSK